MKPKILLCGSNRTLINDFFVQMEFTFECMTTSDRWDDTMCHIKYFKPDMLVYCLYGETRDFLNGAARIKIGIADKDIPIVVIGDRDDCSQLSRIAPGIAQLEIYRPISTKEIESRLKKFVDERETQKRIREEAIREAEEAAKAAEEEAARAAAEAVKEAESFWDIKEMELPPDMIPKSPETKHILIVDDDARMLRMMKNFLSKDYHVATAISGRVALKFLEVKHTDLVLLDYEMPGENGSDVLKQIRSNPNLSSTPVVFLTGVTDRGKIQEVLSNNIQGYLLKPIDMERLSNTITELIG